MRRGRAALVLIVPLMSLLVAAPALAGGPTSVLLVAPGTGQTASLHASDSDYQALADLIGAFGGAGASGKVDPSGTSHAQGSSVTMTWLIHDVQVWRVDHVYFDAVGGPWISTQTNLGESGTMSNQPAVWHTAARGKELAALFERLGVGPDSGAAQSSAARDSNVQRVDPGTDASTTGTAGDATGTVRRAVNGGPGTTELVWGLGGFGIGILLTVVGLQFHGRRRRAPGRPATADLEVEGPVEQHPPRSATDSESWSLTDELRSTASRK